MTHHLPHQHQTSIRRYVTGFVVSVILTIAAYFVVTGSTFDRRAIIAIVMLFAVIQLVVQLVFFLHLGQEQKPRWNIAALLFMFLVVSIVVGGSLWIMNNLNYNMSPAQMNDYMTEQNKKGF